VHAAANSQTVRRLTAQEASLALMFDQVPVAVERLALCLETQRRVGASHALLHLRRIAAVCLRLTVADDSKFGTELRHAAMSLAQPLKDLDDALAADRLDRGAISIAREQLTSIRFQLARLQAVVVTSAALF
jgi:hypothetical protein